MGGQMKRRPCVNPGCDQMTSAKGRTGLCVKCANEARKQLPYAQHRGHAPASDLLATIRTEVSQQFSATDWLAETPILHEDVVVISDTHVDKHDPEQLVRAVLLAKAFDIQTLVVAGDFFDFPALASKLHGERPNEDARANLRRGLLVLSSLLKAFKRIVFFGGNHDIIRLTKALEKSLEFKSQEGREIARLELADLIDLNYEQRAVAILENEAKKFITDRWQDIHWSGGTHCYVESGDQKTLITHQKTGSVRPPYEGLKIWQREMCHVICTHTHLLGSAIAPNGQHIIANMGCGTDKKYHRYAVRHDTGYPNWVLGVATVRSGIPQVYPVSPTLYNWSLVEAEYERRAAT
jgi:predicted phosphodiesterase